MKGFTYPSEISEYTDKKSGLRIRQLTKDHVNFHMYFTDNSFDRDHASIYFFSDRSDKKGVYNLFHMNLDTGIMTQVTEESSGVWLNTVTKTPDSELIAYWSDCSMKVLNTRTGEVNTIYKDSSMLVYNLSFSRDKKRIGFIRSEDVGTAPDGGPNYIGFKEKMFAVKDSRISVINVDGSGFHDVWQDTNWLSHLQFSPDDSSVAMFCHEGPWNYVQQRIWLINMDTGVIWPCFRQGEDDCVGHEFWTSNGLILFDNRRAGHDGTISSDKTQVISMVQKTDQLPYFGLADKSGKVIKQVDMPYYCNHYMANPMADEFVGDGVDDIVLIRPHGASSEIKTLAVHNTTWLYQHSHCHPTYSWDGKKILYAADTDATHCNLFLIEDWQ